jgi:hypothetical protein
VTFNVSTAGPWCFIGIVIGILLVLKTVMGWMADLRQLVDLLKIGRDEEHNARVKAESQRDELLAKYARTTAQVLEALPVPGPLAPDPGGDPDATVAA